MMRFSYVVLDHQQGRRRDVTVQRDRRADPHPEHRDIDGEGRGRRHTEQVVPRIRAGPQGGRW